MSKYQWCVQFLSKEAGFIKPEWINSGYCFKSREEASQDASDNAIKVIKEQGFDDFRAILKAFVCDEADNEWEIPGLKTDRSASCQTREHYK